MKKLVVVFICLLSLTGLASCGNGGTVVVNDRLYVQQIHDMQLNPRQYAGKTIKLAGYYADRNEKKQPANFVYRAVNCCSLDGSDTLLGLEFEWDGAPPQANAWTEVTGTAAVRKGKLILVEVTLKQEGLS